MDNPCATAKSASYSMKAHPERADGDIEIYWEKNYGLLLGAVPTMCGRRTITLYAQGACPWHPASAKA